MGRDFGPSGFAGGYLQKSLQGGNGGGAVQNFLITEKKLLEERFKRRESVVGGKVR